MIELFDLEPDIGLLSTLFALYLASDIKINGHSAPECPSISAQELRQQQLFGHRSH